VSDKLIKCIATFFYIGYAPVASGTVASLAGVFIYIAFHQIPLLYILIFFRDYCDRFYCL